MTLYDIIAEAKSSDVETVSIAEYRKILQAVRTSIPKPIALVRQSFLDTGEYELYEFIQFCEWWQVKNKDAPNWQRTAGVRAVDDKIEFYYDIDFIRSIASTPSKLMFLIAHEASHIFRYHEDRANETNKDKKMWNIATDMVINKDILSHDKISSWKPSDITLENVIEDDNEIKELEKSEGQKWSTLKDKPVGLRIPKDYHDFVKKNKEMKMPYSSDNVYAHIFKQMKEQEKKAPKVKKDYFAVGTIVRVKSGKHEGEYRKITKQKKDGTYITIPVDIQKEIERMTGSSQ